MVDYSSSSTEQVFFIYDHTVLKKEEDDLKDAIVYFHPSNMPVDIQCGLCGQLMGIIRFFQDFSSAPKFYTLRQNKFAVFHVGKYSLALGGRRSDSDQLLERQLESLFSLFKFYHRSIDAVKLLSENNGSRRSSTSIQHIWDSYLANIRHYGDVLATAFENIPWLEMPRRSPVVYMRASYLLQSCQKVKGVIAGCLLFKQRVVCTQLPTDITARLLILRPHQSHLPCQVITPDFDVPDQVRILRIYLSKKEYLSLRHMKSATGTPETISDYSTSLEQSSTPSEHTSQEDAMAHLRNRTESLLVIVDVNEDKTISVHERLLEETEGEVSQHEQSQQCSEFKSIPEIPCDLTLVENHFSYKEKYRPSTPNESSIFEPCNTPTGDVNEKSTESSKESAPVIHENPLGIHIKEDNHSLKDTESLADSSLNEKIVSEDENDHAKSGEIVLTPDSKTQSDGTHESTALSGDTCANDEHEEFRWPVSEDNCTSVISKTTLDECVASPSHQPQCCKDNETNQFEPNSAENHDRSSSSQLQKDSSCTSETQVTVCDNGERIVESESSTFNDNSIDDVSSCPKVKKNSWTHMPEDGTPELILPNGPSSPAEQNAENDRINLDVNKKCEPISAVIPNNHDKKIPLTPSESQTAKLFQRVKSVATASSPEATLGNILKGYDKQSSADTDDAESGIFNDDSSVYSLPRCASEGSKSPLKSWKDSQRSRNSNPSHHPAVRRARSHDLKWNRMNSTSPLEVRRQQMLSNTSHDGKLLKKSQSRGLRERSRTHEGYHSPHCHPSRNPPWLINSGLQSPLVMSHDSGGPSSVNDLTTECLSSPTPPDSEVGEKNLRLKIKPNQQPILEDRLPSGPVDHTIKKRSVSFQEPKQPDGGIQRSISETSKSSKSRKGRQRSRTSLRGSRSSVESDESDGLKSFDLYIQGNSDMLLLLLLEKDAGRNRDTVLGLCQWDMALSQLGDLDAALLKQCSDSGASHQDGDYHCLKFDKTKMNLTGNVLWPVTAPENEFCETAIQMHEEFRKNPSLHDISLRTFSMHVYGQRTATQETYIQTLGRGRHMSSQQNERENAHLDHRTKHQVTKHNTHPRR